MKPDREQLLNDVLADAAGRETLLRAGAQVLRRRRQWRVARQGLAVAVLGIAVGWMLWPKAARHEVAQAASAEPGPVKFISDEELLALFPHVPVGLVTLADGKKKLIFPRPGDEAKYITRL